MEFSVFLYFGLKTVLKKIFCLHSVPQIACFFHHFFRTFSCLPELISTLNSGLFKQTFKLDSELKISQCSFLFLGNMISEHLQ